MPPSHRAVIIAGGSAWGVEAFCARPGSASTPLPGSRLWAALWKEQ